MQLDYENTSRNHTTDVRINSVTATNITKNKILA